MHTDRLTQHCRHLGGSLAVAIAAELVYAGVIGPLIPGEAGILHRLDHPLLAVLSITDLSHGAGPAARGCLDWTERRTHLAGRLGYAMLAALLGHGWLIRRPRDRALILTQAGASHLSALGLAAAEDVTRNSVHSVAAGRWAGPRGQQASAAEAATRTSAVAHHP